MWRKCSSKIDITHSLIMNDYDMYKLIDEYCIEDYRVTDAIKAKKFITKKDWEEILELYTEEHNEFSDSE